MADIIKNEIEFEYEDDIETEEETTFDDLMEKLMRISIDTTNLVEVKFDKTDFQKGMKDDRSRSLHRNARMRCPWP